MIFETMAGKGTEIGRSFEDLKAVIDGVKYKENLGICIDTCHIFDGGHDIANNLDDILTGFDEIIGIEKLAAVHLNGYKREIEILRKALNR